MVDEKTSLILQAKTQYPSIDKRHLWNVKFSKKHPLVTLYGVYDHLDALWHESKGDIAVFDGDSIITKGELLDNSKTIAKAFKELGVKKGNVIFISLPNSHQALECFLAANILGASVAFVDQKDSFNLMEDLREYRPTLYINYKKDIQSNKIIKDYSLLNAVITLNDKNDELEDNDNEYINYAYVDYKDLKEIATRSHKLPMSVGLGSDCALIDPVKGYCYDNKKVKYTCKYISNNLDLAENNRCLSVLPTLTSLGFMTSVLTPLLNDKEVVLTTGITDQDLLTKPDLLITDNESMGKLYDGTNDTKDLSFVKKVVVRDSKEDNISYLNIPLAKTDVISMFGNEELLGVKIQGENKKKTRLAYGPSFVIINEDTNEEVKYDEVGLLCVRGKHVVEDKSRMVMFNDKKYYKTDIRGSLDREGNFKIEKETEKTKVIKRNIEG